jgi:transposase InsO family protein
MAWKLVSVMSARLEFVQLARLGGVSVAELCRRFDVSRKTGYKWLRRYERGGQDALADRDRRPKRSPRQTVAAVERTVVQLRRTHPAWGGRKLRRRLQNLGRAAPAASTITAILHRHGLMEERVAPVAARQRFEATAPNDLWQMDFKGHFGLSSGGRCHPLTVLDDHSRFALGLRACGDERGVTVKQELTGIFRQNGIPRWMLMDNGSPWGSDVDHPYTPLTAWLMRLGIRVTHGRPYHPQTQGKDERFHRTLRAELLYGREFNDLAHCQARFDPWRHVYNHERPHEALGMNVPASRYTASPRSFPEQLPSLEYAPDDIVRKVQQHGRIDFAGRGYTISKAFRGDRVALRPTAIDGRYEVYYHVCLVGVLDIRENPESGKPFSLPRQFATDPRPPRL